MATASTNTHSVTLAKSASSSPPRDDGASGGQPANPRARGSRGDLVDPASWPKGLLFDVSGIDLSRRLLTRKDLERWNPHRGDMALVDYVVWQAPDYKRGIGVKEIREDEFWVPGHFPQAAMFPGVLMIEAAAQLAVYLFNVRLTTPLVAAFTRIEEASFRSMVVPGDDLYLLCEEIRWSRRGFTCSCQGVANGKLTFDAKIQGLAVDV